VLRDLRYNSVLHTKQAEIQAKRHSTHADTIPFSNPYNIINLPFNEDFTKEGPYPDSAKWINNEVFVNRTYPIAPLNYGVATFDGLDKNGYPYDITAPPTVSISCDTLTSKRINMNLNITPGSNDTVYMRFYFQAQGRGNAPEPEDSLFLEFQSSKDTVWREVWSYMGYSTAGPDTGFHRVMIALNQLDTGHYINTPWFQFRFRNFATPCGNLDHWNLDCIQIEANRIYSDTVINGTALAYEPLSFLANYQSMPWRQYQGASDIAPTGHVYIRNNNANGTYPITYKYQGNHYGNPFSIPFVATDPTGPLPFDSGFGYEKVGYVAEPKIGQNGFSFGNSLSDTTVFTINHINYVNTLSTDTLTTKQNFYNYYAYDDGSAEIAYGLEGLGTGAGGSVAVNFNLNVTDTLKAVQFFWSPTVKDVSADGFRLCVWAPGGHSGPGSLMYRSDSLLSPQYLPGYNHFRTYYLYPPLVLPPGPFFVGWMQYTEDNLSVGFDQNTNAMNHNFFAVDSSSNWQFSIFPGSLMIRPLFGDTIRMNGINELGFLLRGVNLFPNPAQDKFYLSIPSSNGETEHYTVQLSDAYGKLLSSQSYLAGEAMDISAFPNGFYFVRIIARDKASCVKKLLIAR